MEHDTRVTIDDVEREVTVEYSYTPPVRGVHTLRNGDPGWPDDPAEVAVSSVKTRDGDELLHALSDDVVARIEDEIAEAHDGRRW